MSLTMKKPFAKNSSSVGDTVAASATIDLEGRMSMQEVTFVSNSLCEAIPVGTYGRTGNHEGSAVVMGLSQLTGATDSEVCFQSDFVLHLDGSLTETVTGTSLNLDPSAIVIKGDFLSTIDATTACPCMPMCSGGACGVDNGCGGTCRCLEGEKCGDDGVCVNSCTADCSGKQCGPDGCGGQCGTCEGGGTCSNGACMGGNQKPTTDVSIVRTESGCRAGNQTRMLPWFPLFLMAVLWWRSRQRQKESI